MSQPGGTSRAATAAAEAVLGGVGNGGAQATRGHARVLPALPSAELGRRPFSLRWGPQNRSLK
jgi:hypothetical protein